MPDWAFVLTPLLMLPIVLLFRFVGCKAFDEAPSSTKYRDHIMAEPNLIAYWRLIEPEGAAAARDEKNQHDGQYVTGGVLQSTPGPPGSDYANGDFAYKQESLILAEPDVKCRLFNGGYVRVEAAGLHTEKFTIEAWIHPKWGAGFKTGFQHTLFSAGGRYTRPFESSPAYHGFEIFASEQNRWQFRVRSQATGAFASPPMIPDAPAHLVVTLENQGLQKRVRLFVNGKPAAEQSGVSYSMPVNAPLLIGVGNRNSTPVDPVDRFTPVISRIQEVALYDTALTPEIIEKHYSISKP